MRPTEPRPIQRPLARISEDKRRVSHSFMMAIHLPLFSGVTLRGAAVTLDGGISLTRNFMKPILTRMLGPWKRKKPAQRQIIN